MIKKVFLSPISLDVQNSLLSSISNYNIYQQFDNDFEVPKYYNLTNVFVFNTYLNEFVSVNGLYVIFNSFYDGHNGYYLRIKHIYFNGFGYCEKTLLNQDGSVYDSNTYNFDSYWYSGVYNKIYCSNNQLTNIPFFSLFFDENVINSDSYFTFDETFNYNSLFQYNVALDPNNTGNQTITQNLSYYRFNEYNGYLTYSMNVTSYTLTYELPFFISNGQLFNRIVVSFVALADGEKVQTLQAGLITNHKVNGINTTLIYRNMRYVNSLSNVSIEVNKRSGALDSSGTYVYYLSTFWNNKDFKTLYFLSDLDEYQSLLFKNINNVLNGSINPNTGNVYNVFDLLTLAFGSLGNFLTIQILPSISLGLLMFIPLVVTLIILVFRLVKK